MRADALLALKPAATNTLVCLFRSEGEFPGPVDPDAFVMIEDPDDRKFAALAAATKTPLVTNDNHVPARQRSVGVETLSPHAFRGKRRAGHLMNVLCSQRYRGSGCNRARGQIGVAGVADLLGEGLAALSVTLSARDLCR